MPATVLDPSHRPRPSLSESPLVLLVEDDATVRELVTRVLRQEGYAVLKARHSTEALIFSGEFSGVIHLLLTDLCLTPHISGRKLAEFIRLSRPGIPVLYMSGLVEDGGVSEEVLRGEAGFLPKPFGPEALLRSVHLATHRPAHFQ